MKILIATGIYPPEAGGPAYYAKSLKEEFEKLGHTVAVRTYTIERSLPIGIRHFVYFFKTIPAYLRADVTILLDTLSVGFPVACIKKLFGGKVILRTGGDFLWENYVERTGEKVLFSKFYEEKREFTLKEKIVFALSVFTVQTVSKVVFSTPYQRDVWMKPYRIDSKKVSIIENAYEKRASIDQLSGPKDFFCAVRGGMRWKNTDTLKRAFAKANEAVSDIELDLRYDIPREELLERLRTCYAVVLVSLGDISPNFVLEALSLGKPIILTNENGLQERIGDAVVYVNPLDEVAIANAIVAMCDDRTYRLYHERAKAFSFEHSYAEIAQAFITLSQQL